MHRHFRARRLIAYGLLAAALWYAADSIAYLRLFEEIPSVTPGTCRRVNGLQGAEDMVLRRDGTIIASVNERNEHVAGTSLKRGGALVLMPRAGQPARVLWDGAGDVFRPHGIDYLVDTDGQEYLFAINHADAGDAVMVFRLEGDALVLQRQVAFREKTLNDLTAVAQDRFYVTVDHGSDNAFVNMVSDYLRIPTGRVDYHDGTKSTVAASGIAFANGIAVTPDRKRLYVASMLAGKVIAFDIHAGGLKRAAELDIPGSPDNVTLLEDGSLLVAAHPQILKLAKQNRDHAALAPSRILRISDPGAERMQVTTVFSDSGKLQSSASVALSVGREIAIGSIFGGHVLVCGDNIK